MPTGKGKFTASCSVLLGLFVLVAAGVIWKDEYDRRTLFGEIDAFAVAVPGGFDDSTHAQTVVNAKARTCIALCGDYLESWRSHREAHVVQGIQMRMMYLRRNLYYKETKRDKALKAKYDEDIANLARSVIDKSTSGARNRELAFCILLDRHLEADRYESVRTLGRAALDEQPSHWETKRHIYTCIFRSFMEEARYREASDFANRLPDEGVAPEARLLYDTWRLEAFQSGGNLTGIATLMRTVRAEYPSLLRHVSVSLAESAEKARQPFETFLSRADYWSAIVNMARGNVEEARRECEAYLAAQSKKSRVTLVSPMLEFLERFAGKAPEAEPEVVWVSKETVSIKASAGRVLVLCIAGRRGSIASYFLKDLEALIEKRGADRLQVLVLSPYDEGKRGADKREIESIRKFIKKHDISLPWGLIARDALRRLSPTDHPGTWVVLNRKGRFTSVTRALCSQRNRDWWMLLGVLREMLEGPRAITRPPTPTRTRNAAAW